MQSIAVFCASSEGNDKTFKTIATKLGETLALQHIAIVYGGSKAGLMGAVANGALSKGGEVIGVIPNFLKHKEIAHTEVTELIVVSSMHERKTIMHDRCEGIIALPGGFGTFEELFEVLTWAQLGHHQKPIGLLNVNGYYDDLLKMNVLRKILSSMGTMDAIEFLLSKLKNTKNNADFFDSMNKTAN